MIKQYQARTALIGSAAILAAALLLIPAKFDPHHGLAGQQAAAASLGLGGHASGNAGGGLGGLGGNLGGGLNGGIGSAAVGANTNASTTGDTTAAGSLTSNAVNLTAGGQAAINPAADATLNASAQTAEGNVSNNLALQQQATGIAASGDAGTNLSAPAGSAGGDLQINARAAVK